MPLAGHPQLRSSRHRPPPVGDRTPATDASAARGFNPQEDSSTVAGSSGYRTGPARYVEPLAAVVVEQRSTLKSGHRRVTSTRTGMRFDPLMPIEGWKALGAKIACYSDATSWWLGDWLAFGQMKYGRRYKEGMALTGLEYQTLRNYAVVARRFELSRRRDNLSFQHHAEVCALPDDDQEFWLDTSAEYRWSKTELRRRLRAAATAHVPTGRARALRLVLEPRREDRWREAAKKSDSDLHSWIMRMLDEAATAALDETPAIMA
jgi:hypothetical protein